MNLLRLPAVLARTGLSKTTIHRLEAAGRFPRRRRVGTRAVAWVAAEVDAWVDSATAVRVTCADAPRAFDADSATVR